MQLLPWNDSLIRIRGLESAHGGRKAQDYPADFSGVIATPIVIAPVSMVRLFLKTLCFLSIILTIYK